MSKNLDSIIIKSLIESYNEKKPILEKIVEQDSALSLIYNRGNSNFPNVLRCMYKLGIIKSTNLGIILTDLGHKIRDKLYKEIEILRSNIYHVENKSFNPIEVERYLYKVIRATKFVENYENYAPPCRLPISFKVIYKTISDNEYRDPLTYLFIGRSGCILLLLYYAELECTRCINWKFSKKYMNELLKVYGDIEIIKRPYEDNLLSYGLISKYSRKNIRNRKVKYTLTSFGREIAKWILYNFRALDYGKKI